MNQEYQGKYFSILGDSISTLSGCNPPDCAVFYDLQQQYLSGVYKPADTWWGTVIQRLGGKLLVNHAWSGSLVCKHQDCEIESYGCSDYRTGGLDADGIRPDVVIVLLGLNDFGWGMPVTGEGIRDPLAVFSVAYEIMLTKLKNRYPQAEIWCLTLPRGYQSSQPETAMPLIRAGWHLQDYCQAIRDCARKTGCRLVDIFSIREPYDTIDGLHPNAAGMQTIAQAVLRGIGA